MTGSKPGDKPVVKTTGCSRGRARERSSRVGKDQRDWVRGGEDPMKIGWFVRCSVGSSIVTKDNDPLCVWGTVRDKEIKISWSVWE